METLRGWLQVWPTLNGFWFFIGVIVALAGQFIVELVVPHRNRPIVRIPFGVTSLIPRTIDAEVFRIGDRGQAVSQVAKISVYRFRVENRGRSAAINAQGTVEAGGDDRRVSWYEGERSTHTLNAYDHSFLDVYGVVLDKDNNFTNGIVFPTEEAWRNPLYAINLDEALQVRLRVTSANARQTTLDFSIDPTAQCAPMSRSKPPGGLTNGCDGPHATKRYRIRATLHRVIRRRNMTRTSDEQKFNGF